MEISSLNDIQKLKAKDLREILKPNSKSTGGIRADLVSKVYALLMWHIPPLSSGENWELLTDVQDLEQNQSDFRYEATMVRISAFGWSSDLHNLPKINFIHSENIATLCWEERITKSWNPLSSSSKEMWCVKCSMYVPLWPCSSRKRKMQPHKRSAVCY